MLRETLFVPLLFAACAQHPPTPANEPTQRTPPVVPRSADAGPSPSATSSSTTATHRDLGLGECVVHVPHGLGTNEKVPLVVILHGLGTSSAIIDRFSDFPSFAEAKRFAWVAPDGPKDKKGRQFWDAGSSCCNFDHIPVDHVAALRALVTRTTAEYPIDTSRVYVVGFSNGGFMAHRLACELGGLVAGIASASGGGVKPDEPCPATGAMRILEIHGETDDIVGIDGGVLFNDPQYPTHISAMQTVTDWAKRYGCNPTPRDAGTVDVEAHLPGQETKISRFEDCKRGAVELWTVTGGGHYVALRAPAHEAIWKFLSNP